MNKTVLIIEDEELLLQAITAKLKLHGIHVISCLTGRQALDYLHNLKTLPDAIWLDYYLPDMNGLEFMQELKKNPAWSKVPVLVVSNSASDDKVHKMHELGAATYLLKAEHRLDDIISTLKQYLNKGNGSQESLGSKK